MKPLLATGICAGAIAGIMTELSGPMKMISWVFFIAILSYYASGCGVDGLKRSLATNLVGIFWGWVILTISGILPIPFSLGISVFIIVIFMCLQAQLPLLSFIPGAFCGCSCFFGTGFDWKGCIYALIVGNILAYVSDVLGHKLTALMEKS